MHARGRKLHKVCRREKMGGGAGSFFKFSPGSAFLAGSRDETRPSAAPTAPPPAAGRNRLVGGGRRPFPSLWPPVSHARLWGRVPRRPPQLHPRLGQGGGATPGGGPVPAQTPRCSGRSLLGPRPAATRPAQPVGAGAGAPPRSSCSSPTDRSRGPSGVGEGRRAGDGLGAGGRPRTVPGSRPELAGGYLRVRTEEAPGKCPLGRKARHEGLGLRRADPVRSCLRECRAHSSEKERC